MSYQQLKARLDRGERVILDGATGSELERRGVPMNQQAWCGLANLTHAEVVEQVHADYIAAGADVITTNTYASSRLMLGAAGMADEVPRIARTAVEAAFRARDRAAHGRAIAVAGSLSHMAPPSAGTTPTDQDALTDAAMLAAFRELATALAACDCDLILLEMMYDPRRIPLAIKAALETGLPVWLGMSARLGDDEQLLSHTETETIPFADILDLMPDAGVEVAGVMHTSVPATDLALQAVHRRFSGTLMAYPDSGYFEMPHWRFVDVMSPEMFVRHCRRWADAGVQVLGGCCGLGVAHIEALVQAGID